MRYEKPTPAWSLTHAMDNCHAYSIWLTVQSVKVNKGRALNTLDRQAYSALHYSVSHSDMQTSRVPKIIFQKLAKKQRLRPRRHFLLLKLYPEVTRNCSMAVAQAYVQAHFLYKATGCFLTHDPPPEAHQNQLPWPHFLTSYMDLPSHS